MTEIPPAPPLDPRRERPTLDPRVRLDLARLLARDDLGFPALRPEQERALVPVVAGRDALVVMPTGAGKSAIYQLAALAGAGPAVVVSPLLALQRDQVEALNARRPGSAAAWNSSLGVAAREDVARRWRAGELALLYLAPESLPSASAFLRGRPPRLAVVDEAHCVLEWGHDFRPDYLGLADWFESWGRPPVLALTATASPPAREEVVRLLDMHDPRVLVAGFDRPELRFGVRRFLDADEKRAALIEDAVASAQVEGEAAGAGIVYCATRESAEGVAQELEARGVPAAAYHGGLGRAERERVQDAFDRNEVRIVAATMAFGLGVDKPDVRFVLHLDPPASLDAYYQEAGRGGRDARAARATLYWCPDDLTLQRFMGGGLQLREDVLERVAATLGAVKEAVAPEEVGDELGLSDARVQSVVRRLEEVGAVEVLDDGSVRAARGMDPGRAVRDAVELQERYRRYVRSRLDMLKAYAEGEGCRRAFLLGYFGEPYDPPCGRCDVCERQALEASVAQAARNRVAPLAAAPAEATGAAVRAADGGEGEPGAEGGADGAADGVTDEAEDGAEAAAAPLLGDGPAFRTGDRVRHEAFGEGEITNVAEGKVTIRFEERGYVQLALDHVLERELLRPGAARTETTGSRA